MKNISILLLVSIVFFNSCTEGDELGSPAYSNGLENSGDTYNELTENTFIKTEDSATSTFSIDADGGSYLNCVRYINEGSLPPADAVRSEEFVNYFKYNSLTHFDGRPIAVSGEVAVCPWNTDNNIVLLKMSGKDIAKAELPKSNLVFLVDVSGSMSSDDKLGLIKKGLKHLVSNLGANDYVSIVTYAGSNTIALDPTSCANKELINNRIESLSSGGGTNGAEGIKTAYDLIGKNYKKGSNNRVILCSDGDFNIGLTSQAELIKLIEQKRETGVYLTTVGVGRGNLNDANMEQIANNGNGNYEYIADEADAEIIFNQGFKKFFTIAEDVKVQITFNSSMVEEYRLLGYENRVLSSSDFNDDTKDAGDLSVNQTVIAMYEIVPNKTTQSLTEPSFSFNVRYKNLGNPSSEKLTLDVINYQTDFEESSSDLQFACGVSAFAQLLRKGKYTNEATYAKVLTWINNANLNTASDQSGDLLESIRKAEGL